MDANNLIGWLCIMRHNLSEEDDTTPFLVPECVRTALEERGWIGVMEVDENGTIGICVSDAGLTVSDLAAPEWGINPVPFHA